MSKEKQKEINYVYFVIRSFLYELIIIGVFCVAPFFLPISFNWRILIIIGGALISLVCAFLIVYFRFAPLNLFWTFVNENTAKVIVKGGEFQKVLMQRKGYGLDNEGNVVEGQGRKHLFGGLVFYGIWPIVEVYGYGLRWSSVRENGEIVQHDEYLDAVMLKEKVYSLKIDGAEDKDRIPLDLSIIVTLRVVNPYKALFVPDDFLEIVLNRIKPLFREHVATVPFRDLISEGQNVEGKVWERLSKDGLIEEFENDYGVRIKQGGVEMKDITPSKEYQDAETKKRLAELEGEKITGETVGAMLNMIAVTTGQTKEQVQEQIRKSTKLSKEFREISRDLLYRKMAIDSGRFIDIRVKGAGGPEDSLLRLIAAFRMIPSSDSEKKA